jgi:hypothetical protein
LRGHSAFCPPNCYLNFARVSGVIWLIRLNGVGSPAGASVRGPRKRSFIFSGKARFHTSLLLYNRRLNLGSTVAINCCAKGASSSVVSPYRFKAHCLTGCPSKSANCSPATFAILGLSLPTAQAGACHAGCPCVPLFASFLPARRPCLFGLNT